MQDNKQPVKPSAPGAALKADIVSDIPVAAPQSAAKPPDEDDELDKIMQDVTVDLKDAKAKPAKHGLFHRHNKETKADPKFSAKPIDNVQPAVKPSAPTPSAAPIKPTTTVSATPKPAAPAKAPKAPKTSRAPVGAILLALLVTGALSAAAVYAYR